jgi:predicted metal-dependent hydrolase
METINTAEIEGVGQVVYVRSPRARWINISVRPRNPVRVAVPRGVGLDEAERMVLARREWIRKHAERMRLLERNRQASPNPVEGMRPGEMRRRIVARLEALAKEHGFVYNRVFVRNQRTRWGSCSVKNNISLNLKMLRLPPELMDYIILHELVHTRVHNHRRAFWDELERVVKGAQGLRSKVRTFRLDLFE